MFNDVKVCKSSLFNKDLKAVRSESETICSGSLFQTGQILFEKKLRYPSVEGLLRGLCTPAVFAQIVLIAARLKKTSKQTSTKL